MTAYKTPPEVTVFATRDEALEYVDNYYRSSSNDWFRIDNPQSIFGEARRIFEEQTVEDVTVTNIMGFPVQIPIERKIESPFYEAVAPEACKAGKLEKQWDDMSDEERVGVLEVRRKFRPSMNYITVDRMVDNIQSRPEGPIRKDDSIFCPISSIYWGFDPPIINPGLISSHKLTQRLLEVQSNWENSHQGKSLRAQLVELTQQQQQHREGQEGMRIDRIVAIGLGTMTEDAAAYQHCMALDLAHGFGVSEVFVQDPAYTTGDKGALRNFGALVISDDRIFDHVNRNTIVICLAPSFPALELLQERLRKEDRKRDQGSSWPAMLIWDKVEWTRWNYDRVTPRVEKMMENYQPLELEHKLDPEIFLDAVVYVRRQQITSHEPAQSMVDVVMSEAGTE